MTPLAYPQINGCRHSFASIELKMAGQEFKGIKSINYTRTRSRGKVMGTSPDPIAKTRGENEYTAEVEIYFAEFMLFLSLLKGDAPPDGYGDVFFDCTVTYGENGFDVVTDEIIGCTLDTTDASNSQGSDPTVRKCTLNPVKIRFGGMDDLAIPLTAPVGA